MSLMAERLKMKMAETEEEVVENLRDFLSRGVPTENVEKTWYKIA